MVTTVVYLKVEIDGDSPVDPKEVAAVTAHALEVVIPGWHGLKVKPVGRVESSA